MCGKSVYEKCLLTVISIMYTFFDVGANSGTDSLHVARSRPDAVVYAFEPTPKLIADLKARAKDLKNYHIIPKAVSDFTGTATFRISGNADWGCSSLCDFNDNLESTWPGRTDFKVTDQVTVDVIQLADFVDHNCIKHIDYLHVDAQGKDLEVLFGLRNHINIVQRGQIEMPSRHDTKLYKDQKYVADDAIKFLESHGFTINAVNSNDAQRNEVNILFTRN